MSGRSRAAAVLEDSSDDDESWKTAKGKGKGKGKSVCKKPSVAAGKRTSKNHNNNDLSSDEEMDLDQTGLGGNDQSVLENSKAFRRGVRSKYRDLMEDLQTNAKDYVDESNMDITEKLLQVDKLYNSVTQTREAAMDSSTIATIALLGKQKAQALKTDMFTFKPTEFAEKLIVLSGGNADKRGNASRGMPEDKWKDLGNHVKKYFRTAPSFTCMLGTFERAEYKGKEKVARQRNAQEKEDFVKNKTKVQELTRMEKSNEETTAKMTEYVYTVLKKYYLHEKNDREPVDFFEFVTDPQSFGRTVENIFYVSFLVREGLAKVTLDDDRLPVIEPVERRTDAEGQLIQEATDTRLFNQVLISFSYPQWKEIVEVFDVDEAIINKPEGLTRS